MLKSAAQDLKHSARLFRQTPGFTVPALAALTLGIAANTAIFAVVNAVLLRPLPYRDPDQIVMFQNIVPAGRFGSASPAEFNWWRGQTGAFQDVAAYDFGIVNWTGESFPEQIPVMRVSAEFFRLCGTGAARGRTFTAADDLPHAPGTAVLAYTFWQRRFGGDPRAIGMRMTLNGEGYEIIGVASPVLENGQIAERSTLFGNIEIHEPPEIYLPFRIDPDSASQGHSFNVAGRLKPGVTMAAASARLQASFREYARKWPGENIPGRGFGVERLRDALAGGVRNSLLLLWSAVSLVLLIACANVANLLLARATARQREIAIRAAVGAGRGRIVRQLLTESAALSAAGGALGLAAGYAGIRALLTLLPGNIPRIGTTGANVELDWRVLSFTAGMSILTGILFGLAPALDASRADLRGILSGGGSGGGTSRQGQRTRALLMGSEMALAVVLLLGAGLLIRSLLALRRVPPGFEARHVLTLRMLPAGPRFENPESVRQLVRDGLRRVRALPGVEAAAATCCVPLEDRWQTRLQVAGWPADRATAAGWTMASAGYFEVFRIPVLRGRAFTDGDENGPPVAVINETLANQLWRGKDPLNDRILIGDEGRPRQIVGVAGDVRDGGLDRAPAPHVYTYDPSIQRGEPIAWVIRTREAPLSLTAAAERELREASGGLPAGQARSMEQTFSRSLAAENFNTLVMTIFGCSALLLAAIGIYGVAAYSAARRAREISIRMALGAEARQIRTMVIIEGLWPVLAGLGIGLTSAFGLARALSGFLFGVKPWDPLVFFVVPLVLTGVALVAVWLPAVRATRADPVEALRSE